MPKQQLEIELWRECLKGLVALLEVGKVDVAMDRARGLIEMCDRHITRWEQMLGLAQGIPHGEAHAEAYGNLHAEARAVPFNPPEFATKKDKATGDPAVEGDGQ